MFELVLFIVDKDTFERMRSYNDEINKHFKNYDTFKGHNIECLNKLSSDEILWLKKMCEMFKDKKIKLVDEESCVEFTAHCFYFNHEKKLCITNPR
jgi:hypothetical protein